MLYSKDVLGRGTENTKVARPKGSCPCEVHSLVGTKTLTADSHQHVSLQRVL